MIACAIENEGGVTSVRDPAPDFSQMEGHDLGVGSRHDNGRCDATLRTDGTEDIGPFITLIAWCARSRSTLGPASGQCALLADARFVLEPDFERLVFGAGRQACCDDLGEVFLYAA